MADMNSNDHAQNDQSKRWPFDDWAVFGQDFTGNEILVKRDCPSPERWNWWMNTRPTVIINLTG